MHVQVPFIFSDFGCSQLRKTVSELPDMKKEFIIKLGSCIENLAIEELYQLILICGPKTDLRLKIEEEEFNQMINRSIEFRRDVKVKHTEASSTTIEKLFNVCINDGQLELIAYMLKLNDSLGVYLSQKNKVDGQDNMIKMVQSRKNEELNKK